MDGRLKSFNIDVEPSAVLNWLLSLYLKGMVGSGMIDTEQYELDSLQLYNGEITASVKLKEDKPEPNPFTTVSTGSAS